MLSEQIIRAWKDPEYRATADSLGAAFPASPVGAIDLPDAVLDVSGGYVEARTEYLETLGCCQGFTQYTKCDVTAGPVGLCTSWCLTITYSQWSWCQ